MIEIEIKKEKLKTKKLLKITILDEQEPSDNQQIEQCKVVQSSASLKLTKHVPTKT